LENLEVLTQVVWVELAVFLLQANLVLQGNLLGIVVLVVVVVLVLFPLQENLLLVLLVAVSVELLLEKRSLH
jgi:hypothetical protein